MRYPLETKVKSNVRSENNKRWTPGFKGTDGGNSQFLHGVTSNPAVDNIERTNFLRGWRPFPDYMGVERVQKPGRGKGRIEGLMHTA